MTVGFHLPPNHTIFSFLYLFTKYNPDGLYSNTTHAINYICQALNSTHVINYIGQALDHLLHSTNLFYKVSHSPHLSIDLYCEH